MRKKIIFLSITGFIICTAFNKQQVLGTARTDKNLITDYRDAFTGNYFCRRSCSKRDKELKKHVFTGDTITITISKDVVDSVLQINFDTQTLKVKLLSSTEMQSYPQGKNWGGKFFALDSINFGYAMGMNSSCNYLGKKK